MHIEITDSTNSIFDKPTCLDSGPYSAIPLLDLLVLSL